MNNKGALYLPEDIESSVTFFKIIQLVFLYIKE
jgi:hypothetical protein